MREELSLSMDEMAEKLDMSTSMYEKIEYGYRVPSRQFISKMKDKFPYIDTNIFFENKVHKNKTNDEQIHSKEGGKSNE
jgi:transcriptional regulator with XRE-family HTH domain